MSIQNMFEISVAEDFTKFPGGRYRKHGRGSGEEFRDRLLLPHLRKHERVKVVLDGTSGYPASFLEEAFGGLVRSGVPLQELESLLEIVAKSAVFEGYRDEAWRHMRDAATALHRN